jgi:hypothetical protein
MIILYIYLLVMLSLGIYTIYLHHKSHSHLTEYGEVHPIKLFWLGSHAGKKYLNEIGLRYKKRANVIKIISIIITLLFIGLMFVL